MPTWRVLVGDVREQLATLPDASVQCVVTSPPYWGLRDYGVSGQIGREPTPDAYVAQLVAVFREVWRALADDGACWLNLGDSYFGTGRGPSDLAPDRGFHTNVTRDGFPLKGIYSHPTLKSKDLVGIPWRVAFALQADGWYLRSDIIWAKPNPMPESVTDRPTKAHEYIFLLTKRERYYYDADAIREPHASEWLATRKPYVINWNADRNDGGQPPQTANPEGRNIRSVWTIATQPYPDAHFATFPEALPERCIKAGSRLGDTVLDPFCGSGTTGQVAIQLGRSFIGIELNPAYAELARTRIASAAPLFAEMGA